MPPRGVTRQRYSSKLLAECVERAFHCKHYLRRISPSDVNACPRPPLANLVQVERIWQPAGGEHLAHRFRLGQQRFEAALQRGNITGWVAEMVRQIQRGLQC